MKTIEDYCNICFETHQNESDKIARVLIPLIQRQIDRHYITGEPMKKISVRKEKFTALHMAYMSFLMILKGEY